jgi:hypothetical protein
MYFVLSLMCLPFQAMPQLHGHITRGRPPQMGQSAAWLPTPWTLCERRTIGQHAPVHEHGDRLVHLVGHHHPLLPSFLDGAVVRHVDERKPAHVVPLHRRRTPSQPCEERTPSALLAPALAGVGEQRLRDRQLIPLLLQHLLLRLHGFLALAPLPRSPGLVLRTVRPPHLRSHEPPRTRPRTAVKTRTHSMAAVCAWRACNGGWGRGGNSTSHPGVFLTGGSTYVPSSGVHRLGFK